MTIRGFRISLDLQLRPIWHEWVLGCSFHTWCMEWISQHLEGGTRGINYSLMITIDFTGCEPSIQFSFIFVTWSLVNPSSLNVVYAFEHSLAAFYHSFAANWTQCKELAERFLKIVNPHIVDVVGRPVQMMNRRLQTVFFSSLLNAHPPHTSRCHLHHWPRYNGQTKHTTSMVHSMSMVLGMVGTGRPYPCYWHSPP